MAVTKKPANSLLFNPFSWRWLYESAWSRDVIVIVIYVLFTKRFFNLFVIMNTTTTCTSFSYFCHNIKPSLSRMYLLFNSTKSIFFIDATTTYDRLIHYYLSPASKKDPQFYYRKFGTFVRGCACAPHIIFYTYKEAICTIGSFPSKSKFWRDLSFPFFTAGVV